MRFDTTKVLANARAASTEDLLDRVTVFRAGMEPEAIELFEMELHRRGVTPEQVAAHAEVLRDCLRDISGAALVCSQCRRPALTTAWGWHWLWGKLPVFPRRYRFCDEHRA